MIHVTKLEHPRVAGNVETMVKHQPLSDITLGITQPNDSALMSNKCLDTANFTVEHELIGLRKLMICLINTMKFG